MMKNYTVTVNGKVYEVTVEEGPGAGTKRAASSAPAAPPAQSPAPAEAPAPVPAAPPAPISASGNGSEGNLTVAAPMPGKILGVKASPGQVVKRGDVLIVLEAMKMENEIVAPSDGVVATVPVVVGDSIEAGTALATLNEYGKA